jgi:hypothetical protein
MTGRDFSVYPVKFSGHPVSLPRPVRAPKGLRPGSRIYVDIGTPGTTIVYGQKVGRVPHWIACEVEANVSADILVRLPQ